MANRLTKGKALFGAIVTGGAITAGSTITGADVAVTSGSLVHVLKNTLARTDTSAKTLFALPANAVIMALHIYGVAVSNAATTATISVGKSGGTGVEYLSGFDVKGATGAGQQSPTGAVLGTIGASAVTVTGIYAETGTASTSGGTWTVIAEYTTL